MKRLLLATLAFFVFLSVSQAQKKLEGKPIEYESPKDFYDDEYADQLVEFITSNQKRSSETPWIVISDRDNNKAYEKPDQDSKVQSTVNFKDWFFVVDSNKDWVKVVKARRSGGLKIKSIQQDIGWIPKKNLVLWSNSLIDPKSLIHRKIFLLNKVKDMDNILKSDNKEIVKIYKSPNGSKTIGSKTIYEFYFVYKRENGRLLIGKDSRLTTNSLESTLIGWVREARASKWNTRIALEPNFDDAAFNERKDDPNKRVVGFMDPGGAMAYANSGRIIEDKVLWNNDPITRNPSELASDGKRLRGEVVRFPMIDNTDKYFRTGAIAEVTTQSMMDLVQSEIDEVKWATITSDVEENNKKREFINVMFLIEGTRSMFNYKQAIMNAMSNLENKIPDNVKIKYGAAVYRDTPEKEVNKLFEMQELTQDRSKVVNFVDQLEFDSWKDSDDWTAARYGLLQTLKKGGFSTSESNIIVALGNYGDYKNDVVRSTAAEEMKDETLVERDEILNFLDKLDMHMVSIQCVSERNRQGTSFNKLMRTMMLESSQRQHRDYVQLKEYFPGFKVANPSMADLLDGNDIGIENGPSFGRLVKPPLSNQLKGADVENYVLESVKMIYDQVDAFRSEMSSLTESGNAMDQSTGTWSPAIAREVYRLLNKAQKGKGYSAEDLKKIVHEKYHLYREIYVAKQPSNADNSALSYVLFMPYEDLVTYIENLKRLAAAYDSSPDKQRDALMSTFTELLKQFTGNDNMSKRDVEKFSSAELAARMQGVEKEGLEFGNRMNFKIGDIRNEKKMPDDELAKLIEEILDKTKELNRIKDLGKKYEFCYPTSNNVYFWVPVEYTF